MRTIFGWNADNMFFLTRDGDIEITTVGFPKSAEPEPGTLYHYANQCLLDRKLDDKDANDEFGRNYTDKMFIRLCETVFVYLTGKEDTFRSLTCRKDGEKYIARLQVTGMTLEYELEFMVELVEKMCRTETKQ